MRALLLALIVILPGLSRAEGFPVRVSHAYGETVIPAEPRRIVSVGYHEQDFLYSLGLAPVGVHEWFGAHPYATWSWAEEARQALGAEPRVQRGFEIDPEWVLSLEPDLILASFAPMDARTYQMLSRIAPVVAAPAGHPAWEAPWQDELRLIGQATGRTEQAETVITTITAKTAEVRARHPDLANLSGTAAHYAGGQIIGYRTSSGGNRFLATLGVQTPTAFDDLVGPGGNFGASLEQIVLFDLDVVVWLTDGAARDRIEALPHYQAMALAREGRAIWADPTLYGAMSFQSPLSISWMLEHLPTMLVAAADGDPATPLKVSPRLGSSGVSLR